MKRCKCGKMAYQHRNGRGYCLEHYHDVDWDNKKSNINLDGKHEFKKRVDEQAAVSGS